MADKTDERIKKSNKIIKDVDKDAANIEKASEKLKNDAIEKTIEVNSEYKPYTAGSLVAKDVNNELRKIIKASKISFSDFVTATSTYLSQDYLIDLSKKDLEDISKKGSQMIDDLVSNTDILTKDIKNMLTQNLGKGISQKQLVSQLKDLYPAYARNASTILNTGMTRLFTDINVSKFEKSDFEWYIWAGPDDKVTREIPCRHWVWHRFPASQLRAITATRMRLWNCRHSIIPIPNSEIKNYQIGELKYA